MKKRVAHIVPSMGIGGVEVALMRSHTVMNQEFDYRVFYIRRKGVLLCGQEPVWKLLQLCIFGRWRPDVVITSLWWAHPIGCVWRMFDCKWMAFFHSSGFSHSIDRIILQWSWKHSDARLVDSAATALKMNQKLQRPSTAIPYVFPLNNPTDCWNSRPIDFIWTGRSAAVKRLDLLIEFLEFAQLYFVEAMVVIVIAGPIPIQLEKFSRTSKFNVVIKQNLKNSDVLIELGRAKFYLLFSDHEGMSMGTVEAVQAGCVAVIRPVGEIPSYLGKAEAIQIKDDSSETIREVAKTLAWLNQNPSSAEQIRVRAFVSIRRLPYYSSSLRSALRKMLPPW